MKRIGQIALVILMIGGGFFANQALFFHANPITKLELAKLIGGFGVMFFSIGILGLTIKIGTGIGDVLAFLLAALGVVLMFKSLFYL